MRRPPLSPAEQDARREYFRKGIEDFRALLEREFRRTHPSGYYYSVPPPNGHDFRVGSLERKVTVDVTLQPVNSQNGSVPREVQQTGPRRSGRST